VDLVCGVSTLLEILAAKMGDVELAALIHEFQPFLRF